MKKIFGIIILACIVVNLKAQGFLHTSGKYIYNGQNEEIILKGIGTGNWMIQEGYMMQSSDVAGTQHEFRDKLIETIGVAKTDSFYNAWLKFHFTKADVDSMKAWGFNSIRVALHYLWFTPPVEDEPITGEITWNDIGFTMTDSLLKWCSDNEIYLILDMHGTPGGQGKNASISDYNPSKPSLWESDENKQKLKALWNKLAEKYSDEPWIGGYDLINETNWNFENSGNENGCNCTVNAPLAELFEELIDTIREHDKNHIVFIGGNCWGNNYKGLNNLASYDDNIVFSFHKYWNYNNTSSIQWMLDKRNSLGIPIWLGESGENSNTWFTNAIRLCESNHIGWSWWPVKKSGINNVLRVMANNDYLNLIEYWKGNGSHLTENEAFQAVLTWAGNHKIENCIVQHDVIDAMIRQPGTTETKPFRFHQPGDTVFATSYDLGRNNYAYYDTDTADYHTSTGEYTAWNSGHNYRNDGVDIEACQDNTGSNGYSIGWTANGEWVQYTIQADSIAGYALKIRHASGNSGSGGTISLELNGSPLVKNIVLPVTGEWQSWQTYRIDDVIVPAGTHKIKLKFEQGGSNLHYFLFENPKPADSIGFKPISAETSVDGSTIKLALNKAITGDPSDISYSDFQVINDGKELGIDSFTIAGDQNNILQINLHTPVYYGTVTSIAYDGNSVLSGTQHLVPFSELTVENKLPVRYSLPARIQAEDFYVNNGFVLEPCSDNGGGHNTGYANRGDYLDYLIHVKTEELYQIGLRVATTTSSAKVAIQHNCSGEFTSVDTIQFTSTGDWQNWETQPTSVTLPSGRYTLRLLTLQGEHNLNWFELSLVTSQSTLENKQGLLVYPTIANDRLFFRYDAPAKRIEIINLEGKTMLGITDKNITNNSIDISLLPAGNYQVKISYKRKSETGRFIKK